MRLVTRGDLDGLTCAVIITTNEKIDDILLIHPQDITDKKVEIRQGDILANVPYHPACTRWFDHHLQTENNPKAPARFDGAYALAPSAAGLAYEYYGGAEKMPQFEELVRQTDRLDSAQLTRDDIENPRGYILLGFTVDGRTGMGDVNEYFRLLVDLLKRKPIEKVLKHPEVKKRCDWLRRENEVFRQALRAHSRMDGNVVVTDFRGLDKVPVGNRFLVYALFPEATVSVRLHWGPNRKTVIAAVAHSILNRTSATNVGQLLSRYGGGGHRGAGTVPLPPARAEDAVAEIIRTLKYEADVLATSAPRR
jgi:oligoribonuclease NrnB/cAMP/cGMP phosphodiesterase (DHH superfamily)